MLAVRHLHGARSQVEETFSTSVRGILIQFVISGATGLEPDICEERETLDFGNVEMMTRMTRMTRA